MLAHVHPSRHRFTHRPRTMIWSSSECSLARHGPPGAQSPFACRRGYLLQRGVSHHVGGPYPSFLAHTGSCVRPNPSHRLRLPLLQRVFAGCRQFLLGDGRSRRYLCNLCLGAWTPAPRCSSRAHARFYREDDGLTLEGRRSAHRISPRCNFNEEFLSRLLE